MPKAKKKRVEQPEQPEAEENEGSIEEEDSGSELEPEEEPSSGAPAVPRAVQHRLALLGGGRAVGLTLGHQHLAQRPLCNQHLAQEWC